MAALLAEFENARQLVGATSRMRASGRIVIDAFTPYPVRGMDKALDLNRPRIARYALGFGALGALLGYAAQWYVSAYDYPLVVGGRPAHAPLAFVPITFEMAILAAVWATVIALLLQTGLPRHHHPVFAVDGFERATIDRFWLAIECKQDEEALRRELMSLGALRAVVIDE